MHWASDCDSDTAGTFAHRAKTPSYKPCAHCGEQHWRHDCANNTVGTSTTFIGSTMDQVSKLTQLHSQGSLDDDEFKAAMALVLKEATTRVMEATTLVLTTPPATAANKTQAASTAAAYANGPFASPAHSPSKPHQTTTSPASTTPPPTAPRAVSFIIDSGSTFHTHPVETDLVDRHPCSQKFSCSDGSTVKCRLLGHLPGFAQNTDGFANVHFSYVHHVPAHRYSLLSVRQLQ